MAHDKNANSYIKALPPGSDQVKHPLQVKNGMGNKRDRGSHSAVKVIE
jgi:hypothetical protein